MIRGSEHRRHAAPRKSSDPYPLALSLPYVSLVTLQRRGLHAGRPHAALRPLFHSRDTLHTVDAFCRRPSPVARRMGKTVHQSYSTTVNVPHHFHFLPYFVTLLCQSRLISYCIARVNHSRYTAPLVQTHRSTPSHHFPPQPLPSARHSWNTPQYHSNVPHLTDYGTKRQSKSPHTLPRTVSSTHLLTTVTTVTPITRITRNAAMLCAAVQIGA